MIFLDLFTTFKRQVDFERMEELSAKRFKVLPAYTPSATSAEIQQVRLLDGQLYSCLKGHKYPIRGYNQSEVVSIITDYKKLAYLLIKALSEASWVNKGIILLSLRELLKTASEWLGVLFERHNIVPLEEYWSIPVRELRKLKIDKNILDGICLVLEFDSAYRYRFQDLVGEMTTGDYKDICLLLDKIVQREQRALNGLHRIKKFLPLLKIYLRLSPRLLREIKKIVGELDLNKIKLSTEDKYWVCGYEDYDFLGMSFDERTKLRSTL